MSRSGKVYEIGHRRPSKATQWKKGKSANPGGRSSPRPIGMLEMIDKRRVLMDAWAAFCALQERGGVVVFAKHKK